MRSRSFLIGVLLTLLAPACAWADAEHVVAPGETLTSVAATDGLSVSALAAANDMSPTSELIIGELIQIPPLTPATGIAPAQVTPVTGAATTVTTVIKAARTPHPTVQRVDAQELAAGAQANDVPAALVEAVAWQESGWNNDELSADGAVGVMQIIPSTWRWIDRYLTPADPLNGDSATDNIRAGALLLRQLLADTRSQRRTIEAYYQGLASVEQDGVYPSTQRYVRDVLAIERQLAD